MGLFGSKLTCSFCGGKAKKDYKEISDGVLCKKCMKKISPWFDFSRVVTAEEIKANMEVKEQMAAEEASFSRDLQYGEGLQKLCIDKTQRKFMITDDLGHNPDIYSLDAIKGLELKKREHKYNPDGDNDKWSLKREYMYNFRVVMTVDDPYVKRIPFSYKAQSIMTGETRLTDETLDEAKKKAETPIGQISNFLSSLPQKKIDLIEATIAEGEAIIAELEELL